MYSKDACNNLTYYYYEKIRNYVCKYLIHLKIKVKPFQMFV